MAFNSKPVLQNIFPVSVSFVDLTKTLKKTDLEETIAELPLVSLSTSNHILGAVTQFFLYLVVLSRPGLLMKAPYKPMSKTFSKLRYMTSTASLSPQSLLPCQRGSSD